MAAPSEWGQEEQDCLEETDVYKATSSSDFVVVRHVRLYRSRFITYHSYEENKDDNKHWLLSAHCELQPRTAAEIREPTKKLVRPRGQWAITTLVKPKSIGTKGPSVYLYTFTISWPTRWATKGYTSFTFGFKGAEEARHWHARLSECLKDIRREKALAAASTASASTAPSAADGANSGLGRLGSAERTSGGRLISFQRMSSSAAGNGAAAAAAAGPGLPKSASMGGARRGHNNTGSAPSSAIAVGSSQTPSPFGASEPVANRHRRSMTEVPEQVKRTLVFDGGRAPILAGPVGEEEDDAVGPPGTNITSSMPNMPSRGQPPSAPLAPPAAVAAAAAAKPRPSAAQPAAAPPPTTAAPEAPTPRLDRPFCPSSSDSDEAYEEAADEPGPSHRLGSGAHTPRHRRSGQGGRLGGGSSGCRPPRATARGDVCQARQRWVPYKQVNGVAIYHRRQTAGDAEAGVGGEFMVSTVVRGSPRRCLEALTAHCGNTTLLGPATRLEVLQRRQADDGKEIQRIVLQAPGVTGVICAPRELVIETVFKTDETGPTLVLMFQSCEPPARFVERRAGGQPPGRSGGADAEEEEEEDEEDDDAVETYQAAPEGARRSWWRNPVPARVQGGYTIAPLEEYSLDSSPEALVTCIMKVDLGGVCGERSWVRLAADLVGWTDAFMDRMLMAVTLLRDQVEQDRFVAQPLNMVASRVTPQERDRESASAPDLPAAGLGLCGRIAEASSHSLAATAATAAGGGGGGARRGLQCLTTALTGGASQLVLEASGSAGGNAASPGVASSRRQEVAQASLVDASEGEQSEGAAGGVRRASGADGTTAAAAAGAFAGGAGALAAAEAVAASLAGPCAPQYETMDDVLARMRRLACLNPSVWDQLHQPGKDAPFKIRGPTYLKDRKKIPAGHTRFVLGSMDVISLPPGPVVEHVARFLPSIRESGAPFSLIVHLVIPGTPLLGIVATFVSDRHPSTLGTPPASPMEDDHDWQPFDFVLHKYMTGSTHTRNHMLKLIPHIADGSWMIKQSVGTTPVILGKQLRTIYYETPQYLEIDIDISANNVASYVTGLVRGATRSLVIDMGFVLEGTTPWELPEALLGTLRLYNLDIRDAKPIDVNYEIPLKPVTLPPRCETAAAVSAAAAAAAAPVANGLPPALPTHGSAPANGSAHGGSGAAALSLLSSFGSAPSPTGGAARPATTNGTAPASSGSAKVDERSPLAAADSLRTSAVSAAPPSPAR